MTVDKNIKDEKPQNDINRKAAKISALSSGKIDDRVKELSNVKKGKKLKDQKTELYNTEMFYDT